MGDMPMIEKMSESSGPVAGYKVEGKVTPDDYRQLEPDVKALADKYDTISVLLDLQEFTGEEVKAWLPDLKFGHRFHDKIARMAIVGDKRWETWMTEIVRPFYARKGKFFLPEDADQAWAWLREKGLDDES
jgi:hypothetical protein